MNNNTGTGNSGYRNSGNWNSGDGNSEDWNSGNWNSGDWNSGDSNSGDSNSGYWNSGDSNSGNWNSGNWNSGFLNSEQAKTIRVFNKDCDVEIWESANKPSFMYFDLCTWVSSKNMTDKEKEENPTHETTGGYLKTLEHKEAWQQAYNKASQEEIEQLKALPNFDAEVFKEISGIDIKETAKVKVTANGKTIYISKDSAKELGLED